MQACIWIQEDMTELGARHEMCILRTSVYYSIMQFLIHVATTQTQKVLGHKIHTIVTSIRPLVIKLFYEIIVCCCTSNNDVMTTLIDFISRFSSFLISLTWFLKADTSLRSLTN